MSLRKQSVGIDVSKDQLDVKLVVQPLDSERFKISGSRKFANTRSGVTALCRWVDSKTHGNVPLVFTMEATGVYHELLAYTLHQQQRLVAVVLPNLVKAYARSLGQYTKTDAVDALLIARLGVERHLRRWQPATDSSRQLRHLTRERHRLLQDRLRHQNQLHALEHSQLGLKRSQRRHQVTINLINRQINAIEEEIHQLQQQDDRLAEHMRRLQTIPYVGQLTAASVLAETDSFNLFTSRSQVVKYAGMDIVERQSGTSVHTAGRLSKRGNRHLRRSLHMPAVGLLRHEGPFGELYRRVYDRTRCKMKAVVAVQRKLLTVMFALIKAGTDYTTQTHLSRCQHRVGEPEGSPTVTAP